MRARTVKEEVWSEAKKLIRLVREVKNARLILYSLRPYLAPFKTDCTKKGLFCKLLQVTRSYFCADLIRMEENKEILNNQAKKIVGNIYRNVREKPGIVVYPQRVLQTVTSLRFVSLVFRAHGLLKIAN